MTDIERERLLAGSSSSAPPCLNVYSRIAYTGLSVRPGRIDMGFVGSVTAIASRPGSLGNSPAAYLGNLSSAREIIIPPDNSDIGIASMGMSSMIQGSDAKTLSDYVATADVDAVRHLALDLIAAMGLAASGRPAAAARLLNSWIDTAEINLDTEALEEITEARDEVHRGGGRPWRPRSI